MENSSSSHGGRNLAILGLAATFIALITSGVSLYLYHSSGDIYLDRSRPGYLPDEKEDDHSGDDYTFSDTGIIDEATLEDYLRHFDYVIAGPKAISSPFSGKSISDDTLGIPKE